MRALLVHTAIVLVALLAAVPAAQTKTLPHPLRTAVYPEPADLASAQAKAIFARVKGAGASMVRLNVYWRDVAPEKRPRSWNPADAGDGAYRWSTLDRKVQLATKAGLAPVITVLGAPTWAQRGKPRFDGSVRPDPKQFQLFGRALARRYSGHFRGLPRVRFFEAWNEPNLSVHLRPQLQKGKPVAPGIFRQLVNGFAGAVHGVHRDNVVIAGGLAPFGDRNPAVMKQDRDWGPMSFMRSLLCLSKSLKKTCNAKISFDVWAMHPYTSGNYKHKANLPNDVSLGDLPKMKAALDAARRHHTIRSRRHVEFWITEFSWDSRPPDPKGVPVARLMHWIPEAMYQMWSNGVSNLTWFLLRDNQYGYLQSGLYRYGKTVRAQRPKPILRAFKFPVALIPRGSDPGKWFVWGRTPWGKRATVRIQHISFGRRKTIATLKTDRFGIFQGTYDIGGLGYVQVSVVGSKEKSPPYTLRVYPDTHVDPFGDKLDPPER